MIKFAAILTSAAIACLGVGLPAREGVPCRAAARRCGCRVVATCTVPVDCTDDRCDPGDWDIPAATPAPTQAPVETQQPTQAPTQTEQPAQTPAPTQESAQPGVGDYAQEVVRLVNLEREKEGLEPLEMDLTLCAAAQVRAQEIQKSFSHTRPDGSSCFSVLKEFDIAYRACGENIAKGSPTPERVVEGWMNSAGHRANILNRNFTAIGVGVYQSASGTMHWAQLFTA